MRCVRVKVNESVRTICVIINREDAADGFCCFISVAGFTFKDEFSTTPSSISSSLGLRCGGGGDGDDDDVISSASGRDVMVYLSGVRTSILFSFILNFLKIVIQRTCTCMCIWFECCQRIEEG